MKTERVRADWLEDRLFLLRDHNDYPLVMTQPLGVSGADLLPLGLIGCAAWDVVDILHKQRQKVTGLQVFADSERDEDPPWKFKRIHVHYKITGHNLRPDRVQQAITLSETKYCSIFATLRDAVTLSSSASNMK